MSQLPKGWAEDTLGRLVAVERGSSPRPIKNFLTDSEDGVNWIKIGDAKKGQKLITATAEKITKEGATKSRFVDVGDFILSNSMSFGLPYIMGIPGYIHDGWFVFRLPKQINSDYFYYLLSSSYVSEQFNNLAVGGVVKNISGDLVKKAILPLPPFSEQQRIVEKLDEVLAQVDTIKARLDGIPAILKRFRQSVLAAAVSGKLTEGCKFNSYRIEDVCEILNGARKPVSSAKRKEIQGSYPYYGATGVVDHVNGWTHDDRLLLVGEDGANLLSKAKDLAFIVEGRVWVNNHAHVLKQKHAISLEYIRIAINSMDISQFVTGSAQPKLTKKALQNLPVSLPSYKEQKEIVRLVDQYFAFADTIEAQVKKAQARVDKLTQSILAKAFRGELVPQDPSDEPADKLLERIAAARKEAEALAKAAKKAVEHN
ncbi:restriction endonuclease subunit S [Vibrio cholerae]|uniref:restriction endonuclease subunit S n=1 Tax=Vibrio cholerae TaxID=666 RepID=UPI0002C16573|nr:restriction endonuclease subunit S [Vibrio cholerae]EMQ54778.1 type I restriction modification DNA specificity domain protein [Vibrio cholerae O1 str. EM-1676A]